MCLVGLFVVWSCVFVISVLFDFGDGCGCSLLWSVFFNTCCRDGFLLCRQQKDFLLFWLETKSDDTHIGCRRCFILESVESILKLFLQNEHELLISGLFWTPCLSLCDFKTLNSDENLL